jgi:hypothetical protein
MDQRLIFNNEPVTARFIAPDGSVAERIIEIRTNPITFRTSRVTLSRIGEKEKGTESLPDPPPDADRKVEKQVGTLFSASLEGHKYLHEILSLQTGIEFLRY